MAVPHDQAARIFDAAAELESPAERAAYLDVACGQDRELRAEVEELLRHDLVARSFLGSPAIDPTFDPLPAGERPGTVIGPYKLLEPIGEGGFGVVFLAEQSTPVRRKVALKVLKPGMDTRQVVARFEAERQALAIMDHPNIAKVFDGGATEYGRPFFVMELVKGLPITDYCDQNHLTLRQRLELFLPVCQAVQHAHQKGVIHRDLKPSNVLVASHDGTPVVKVIDFGVAKALGQELTDKTLFTGQAQMVGTPLYMSPEQAGIGELDVDTRSDIYSLGVLLYELLTGTTPFTKERFQQAQYDEIRRIIREEEPPKPSSRLSESTETLPSISAQRHMEPAKLTKLVRGELDWIVMKALDKDRRRRYETANSFAIDVQRYLADEPVQACPPSAGYRLRKLIRRNKAAFAVLTIAVAAAAFGMIGLAVNNRMVAREKKRTEVALEQVLTEKERADQNLARARKAVKDYLTVAANNRLLKEADFHELRRELLTTALPYYEEFVRQKSDDPDLEAERGRAYGELAMVREDLGEMEQALENHEQRRAIFERLAAVVPTNPDFRREEANSYRNAGNVHLSRNNPARAEEALRQAITILEALFAEMPTSAAIRQDLAGACSNLAVVVRNTNRPDKALKLQRRALDLQKQLEAEFPAIPNYRRDLAQNHCNMATTFNALGQHENALNSIQLGETLFKKLAAEFPKTHEYREFWSGALNNKSVFLCGLGRFPDGLAAQEEALRIQEELAADFSSLPGYQLDLAMSHANLGVLQGDLNRPTKALESYDKAQSILNRLIQRSPSPQARQYLALIHTNRGEALRKLNRNEDAVLAIQEAVNLQVKLVAEFKAVPRLRQDLGLSYGNLGELLTMLGRYDKAGEAYKEAITIREQLAKDSPSNAAFTLELAGAYGGMGTLVQMRGQPKDSLAWYTRAIDKLEPLLTAEPRLAAARQFAATSYGGRALAHGNLANHADAIADLTKALEFDDGSKRDLIRLQRARTRAHLKMHEEAAAEANQVASADGASADVVYDAACIHGLAVGAAGASKDQADRYAARAVELLRQAIVRGYKDRTNLKENSDLDSLRGRDDFQKLMKELDDGKKRSESKKP